MTMKKKILFISGGTAIGRELLDLCAAAFPIARHGAGVRMDLPRATPQSLALAIRVNLDKPATYPPIPAGGARKTAELICGLLEGPSCA